MSTVFHLDLNILAIYLREVEFHRHLGVACPYMIAALFHSKPPDTEGPGLVDSLPSSTAEF